MTTFGLEQVRAAVAGTRFADVRWVAETGSTNADLLARAADGEGEGVVLGADHQTAGRGRRGRTWEAPPETSILVSVLVRPPAPAVDLVTPAVAVAAAAAVEAIVGVAPALKWPNDLVVGRRKLAGILAEASWPPGVDIASGWAEPSPSVRVPVVVGMGLNVRSAGRDPELADVAIACDELGGAPATREDLVAAWLVELDRTYARAVDPDGRDELWAEWRRRSATLGQRVRVDLGTDDIEGTAVDITPGGQLVVETVEGDRRTLAVGDVTHLRPL